MSYKSNGIKLTKCDSQQWKTTSVVIETGSVKFAGEEAKDRLYEPKHKKKAVRVLTVVAYVFFVSLAAIMLSLYYIFLWNGDEKVAAKLASRQLQNTTKCDNILEELQRQIRLLQNQNPPPSLQPTISQPSTTPETTTWFDEDFANFQDNQKSDNFEKLLNLNDYPYNEVL
ncbi:putative transmembrane protein INAFM2 isoform X1 [Sitophilus oryzae]|uniref:Transmembrane protein INAFM2 isoform X1 n=1 Tax=Sitophilus oryzae TaxID=7048 RepID=A0A6J2YI17_SITOR|nr:putative transmembrane protein INAFM2 isoform X1 [Sitophilus oryzae]